MRISDWSSDVCSSDLDNLRMRQLSLELLDPDLDEALLLARAVVLGVLLQVAVRTRLGDRVDHRRALDRLEFVQLCAQALRALGGPWCSNCFLTSRPEERRVGKRGVMPGSVGWG